MAKENAKILQLPGLKKAGSWRLQPSAIFWRSFAFLFPSFAIWQWHWQMALLASLLFMAFFLFFIPQYRLELLTQEAKKPPFGWLRKLLQDRRNVSTKARSSIFGNYSNDGTGNWGKIAPDNDDGITIEDYLNKGANRKKFDWNWQNESAPTQHNSVSVSERFSRFWQQNWTVPWSMLLFGDKSFGYIFFGTSLLWGLLLYWGLGASVSPYPPFMVLTWGLLYPFLEHWQNRKLFYALEGQSSLYTDQLRQASKLFFFAIELGSSLAIILLIWPMALRLGGFWSFTFFILLLVNIWFRMSLWQKLQRGFLLYVYRSISCLSVAVGFLLSS